ncbi:MAG: response regulator [Candidatus Omnitrophica bacterium]|nr:response regulator [Candidatus Omnitrophota bacterium]
MSEKKKILIVDDEEDFATLSAVRIEEAGYEVYTESDGEKVLDRVRQIRPDLVVLDIMLLGVDGLTVLKKIKKEMKDLPVIVVTGKAIMMSEVFTMEGAAGFFKKPADLKALVKRIQELIGNGH